MSEENGLPKGWVSTSVGEIYDIVGGGTPSTSIEEYWKGDIAWITSADICGLKDIQPRKQITKAAIGNSATNLVPAGSLIVVTRVGLGKVALAKMPLCFSQDSQALIGDSYSIYPDYSLYSLAQAVQVFKYQNRGTTIAGVTKKQLSELPFALPPFPEQQRIVAAIEQQFSRLDAGVAALRQAQAKLKRYRAAVLKAAVEGKLTESWRAEYPSTETASQLLERILPERRAKWEADLQAKGKDLAKAQYVEPAKSDVENLPALPGGWCWATVEQICSLQRGRFSVRPRNDPRYYGGSYPFIQIGDLPENGGNIVSFRQTLNDKGYKVSREFPVGTVLVSIAASIGSTGILTFRSCFPDSLVGIVCQDFSTSRYLEMFLQTQRLELKAQSYASGGQPNINLPILQKLTIPLPPLTEQEQIVAEVERRLSVISQLESTVEANLKRAERLRQSILKEAFAGRLVPQDPDDEPASVLLERIRKEREKRKHGVLDKGRVVICEIPKPKKIDLSETKQVELWESGSSGE